MKNLAASLAARHGAGCGNDRQEELGPVKYGCPHADYEIKGRVTTPDGNPRRAIGTTTDAPHRLLLGNGKLPAQKHGIYGRPADSLHRHGRPRQRRKIRRTHGSGVLTGEDCLEPGDGRWYDGAFCKEVDVQLEPGTEP